MKPLLPLDWNRIIRPVVILNTKERQMAEVMQRHENGFAAKEANLGACRRGSALAAMHKPHMRRERGESALIRET